MSEVVLVRHGETQWSLTGKHTGSTDVDLTAEGESQAGAVGAALQGRTFALVLSSPLSRARRTAELAGFPAAQVDPDLAEWDYGGYEGLTTAQIRAQLGHPWTVFADGVPPPTPGESLEQVSARADRVVARARAALTEGDVLVFSHGHLLRVLGARWVGADPTVRCAPGVEHRHHRTARNGARRTGHPGVESRSLTERYCSSRRLRRHAPGSNKPESSTLMTSPARKTVMPQWMAQDHDLSRLNFSHGTPMP